MLRIASQFAEENIKGGTAAMRYDSNLALDTIALYYTGQLLTPHIWQNFAGYLARIPVEQYEPLFLIDETLTDDERVEWAVSRLAAMDAECEGGER